MNERVARANIEHYELLLKSNIDNVKRATVARLLAEEEDKLARILAAKKAASLGLRCPRPIPPMRG